MKLAASKVQYGDVVRLPGIGQVTVTTVRREGPTTVLCTATGADVCETTHRVPSESVFEVQRPGSLFGDPPKQARVPASSAEEIFEESKWWAGGKTWPTLHRHLNARMHGFSEENRKARATAFKYEIAIGNALRRALALPKRPTVAQVDKIMRDVADNRPQSQWVRVGILEPGGRWWILQDADTRREKAAVWAKSTGPFTLGLGKQRTRDVLREATRNGERPFHVVLLPLMESQSTGGSGSGTVSHPLGRVEYEAPKELLSKAAKTRAKGANEKRAIRNALERRGWDHKRSGRYDYVTDPDDMVRIKFRDRSVMLQTRDFENPLDGNFVGTGKWDPTGFNIGSAKEIAEDLDAQLAGLDRVVERVSKAKAAWVSYKATEASRRQATSSWEDDTNPDVTVQYSFADGILVCGQTKQHAAKLKTLYGRQRLRFSGRMLRERGDDCSWYVPKTRGTIQDYGRVESLAKALRDKGLRVALNYEKPDEQTAEERDAQRGAKLERVAEKRQAQAAKAAAESDASYKAAKAAGDRLPYGGEPVKVGHHSERRHRRDIDRAQRAASKHVEKFAEAKAASSTAARASARADYHGTLPDLYRRYRRAVLNLEQANRPSMGEGPNVRRQREELGEDIAYLRKQIEQKGGKILGPEDFYVGQVFPFMEGMVTVKRVNKKTLTLEPDPKTIRADFRALDIWKPSYLELLGKTDLTAPAKGAAKDKSRSKAPDDAQRRKAAAKLRKVADTLDKRATEALERPSEPRTARQLRMAAQVHDRAVSDQDRAETLRRVADRMESGGRIDPALARVSSAKDVEAIEMALLHARNRRDAKQPGYRSVKAAPSSLDVPYAEVGRVVAHAGNLDELAKFQKRKADGRKIERAADRIRRRTPEGYGALTDDEIEAVTAALNPSSMKSKPSSYTFASLKEQVLEQGRLRKLGITSDAELRRTLEAYLACCRGKKSAPTKEQSIATRERELMLQKIPGFFPTPDDLAERMVKAAQLKPGDKVLEPSAGSGRIAAAIRRAEPKAELTVIEFNNSLRKLLEDQGFKAVGGDFLNHNRGREALYDAIVMNPPFEKRADAHHLRRAMKLVKPGGRVVSIVSGSFPTRTDRPTTDLRAELDKAGAKIEALPPGSFAGAGTNVNTALVVYRRPGAADMLTPTPPPPRKEKPAMAKPTKADREDKVLSYQEISEAWDAFRKTSPSIKAIKDVPLKAIGNFCLQATDDALETSVTVCPALQPRPVGDCPAMAELKGGKIYAVCQAGRDTVYFGRKDRDKVRHEVNLRFKEARIKAGRGRAAAQARKPGAEDPVPGLTDFVAQANLLAELLPLGIVVLDSEQAYLAEISRPKAEYDYAKSKSTYKPVAELTNPNAAINRRFDVPLQTLIANLAKGSWYAFDDPEIPYSALVQLEKLRGKTRLKDAPTLKDARRDTVAGRRVYWLENAAGERIGPISTDGKKPPKAVLTAFTEKHGGRAEVPPPASLPKGWTLEDTIVLGVKPDKQTRYGAYHVPDRQYKISKDGKTWQDGGMRPSGIWPDYTKKTWREGAWFGEALRNTLSKQLELHPTRRPRVWGPWHGVGLPGVFGRDAVLWEPATGVSFPLIDLQKAMMAKSRATSGTEKTAADKALRYVRSEIKRAQKAEKAQQKAAAKARKKAVAEARKAAKETTAAAKAQAKAKAEAAKIPKVKLPKHARENAKEKLGKIEDELHRLVRHYGMATYLRSGMESSVHAMSDGWYAQYLVRGSVEDTSDRKRELNFAIIESHKKGEKTRYYGNVTGKNFNAGWEGDNRLVPSLRKAVEAAMPVIREVWATKAELEARMKSKKKKKAPPKAAAAKATKTAKTVKPCPNFACLVKRKNRWIQVTPAQLEKNPKIADELFELIQTAYAPIGGHLKFRKASDVKANATMIVTAVDIDADPQADVVQVDKKKPAGRKSVAMGHDGTRAAKDAAIEHKSRILRARGNYAEMSGKIAHIMIKRGIPAVKDPRVVADVLGKPIEWVGAHPEGKYPDHPGWYYRTIGGKRTLKVLLGYPKSKLKARRGKKTTIDTLARWLQMNVSDKHGARGKTARDELKAAGWIERRQSGWRLTEAGREAWAKAPSPSLAKGLKIKKRRHKDEGRFIEEYALTWTGPTQAAEPVLLASDTKKVMEIARDYILTGNRGAAWLRAEFAEELGRARDLHPLVLANALQAVHLKAKQLDKHIDFVIAPMAAKEAKGSGFDDFAKLKRVLAKDIAAAEAKMGGAKPAKRTTKKTEAVTKPVKRKTPRKRKPKSAPKARDYFFVRDQDGKVLSRHTKLEPAVMAAKRAAIDQSMAGAAKPGVTVWEGSQAGKAEPSFAKRRARVTAPSLAQVDTTARVEGDRYHAGVLGMCGVVMGKAAARARKAKKAAKRGKTNGDQARKNTRALIRQLAGG